MAAIVSAILILKWPFNQTSKEITYISLSLRIHEFNNAGKYGTILIGQCLANAKMVVALRNKRLGRMPSRLQCSVKFLCLVNKTFSF